MIDLFLQEAPGRLAAARKAEQTGEIGAIGEAAHALKSSAQNFGAIYLSQIAQKIERLAKENRPGEIPALLDDLERAFAEARAWLESQRDSFKP
ncbi:MAG: two-component system, sensor histidine kinase and response regulator [Chthoniobacter sp.]|nr:two-component system, sensor histidine kinase and response regulator [Chthoniobacter sp.]